MYILYPIYTLYIPAYTLVDAKNDRFVYKTTKKERKTKRSLLKTMVLKKSFVKFKNEVNNRYSPKDNINKT